MKIVIADPLPVSATTLLRDQGWEVDTQTGRPQAELHAALADADALIIRSATHVDADLIAKAPRLKVIARAGTGIDNVDLDAATVGGILVVNAPGANSISVAEHAFALLLTSARSIAHADSQMKAGRWEKKGLMGTELWGKTLGIIGLGRIGRGGGHPAQGGRRYGRAAFRTDVTAAAQVVSATVTSRRRQRHLGRPTPQDDRGAIAHRGRLSLELCPQLRNRTAQRRGDTATRFMARAAARFSRRERLAVEVSERHDLLGARPPARRRCAAGHRTTGCCR